MCVYIYIYVYICISLEDSSPVKSTCTWRLLLRLRQRQAQTSCCRKPIAVLPSLSQKKSYTPNRTAQQHNTSLYTSLHKQRGNPHMGLVAVPSSTIRENTPAQRAGSHRDAQGCGNIVLGEMGSPDIQGTHGSFPIGLISNLARFQLGSIRIAFLPNSLPNYGKR